MNIRCGSYSHPDVGCSAEMKDANAAYVHALQFLVSNKTAHATLSRNIVMSYANNLKEYQHGPKNSTNAPLQAGWAGAKWTRTAEVRWAFESEEAMGLLSRISAEQYPCEIASPLDAW